MVLENTKDNPGDQIVIPLYAEEVSIGKKKTATSRVRVSTVTHAREQLVNELLQSERVEIEHVPVGHVVAKVPDIRTEGDVTIIPVVEEKMVVQRQLVLKEEVRIRKIRETQDYKGRVVLRQQQAVVTRSPEDGNPAVAIAAPAAEQ